MGFRQNLANDLAQRVGNSFAGDGTDPSPASILGASYHSDWDLADPAVVLSGGTVVTSVPNKGLGGGALVVGPGTGGTWEAAGFGGAPSMQFNAGGTFAQAMMATFDTPIPAGSRAFVWAAMQAPTLAGTCIAFDLQSADNTRALLYYLANSGGWSVLIGANAQPFVTGNPIAAFDTNRHFYELGNVAGGTAAYGLDNATGNLSGAGGVSVTDVPLTKMLLSGYGPSSDQRGNARYARLIVSSAEPTAEQRAAMKAYFKRTYTGLSL